MDVSAARFEDLNAGLRLWKVDPVGQLDDPFFDLAVLLREVNDHLVEPFVDKREEPQDYALANNRADDKAHNEVFLQVVENLDCYHDVRQVHQNERN